MRENWEESGKIVENDKDQETERRTWSVTHRLRENGNINEDRVHNYS